MVVNNWKSGSAIQDYSEDYQYDLNGNILRVKRNAAGAEANSSGTGMDDLEYVYENIANEYKRETNKLRQVIDHQTGSSLTEDFKSGQSPDNYDYDEIGNLIADEQEKIENIEWTVSGKIRKVTRKQEAGVSKPDLEFAYDASGNRIMKLEKPRVDGDLLPEHEWRYTYYVRDASGNVMRTYTKKYTEESSGYAVAYKVTEAPVYGSSRLGLQTLRADEILASRPFTATLSSGRFSGISYTADPAIEPALLSHVYSLRGVKQYELNDHLGNVKVVVSDSRGLPGSPTGLAFISGYEGDDYNVWNDRGNYSTRRSTEYVRTGTYALKLRYDEPAGVFQGPELKIPVEPGDIIDLEVYTLWEAGPGTKPGAIDFKIINGEGQHYNFIRTTQSSATANVWHRSSIDDFEVMAKPPGVDQLYLIVRPAVYSNEYITWFDDMKLTVRSGSEESSRTADVKSYSDYYAFGMQMPGRYANDGYRYGFGGHEKDDEIKGSGNHYSFGDYGYDPRLGRRWNVDPLAAKLSAWSPYSYGFNNPIIFLDPDGAYPITFHIRSFAPFDWFGPFYLFKGDNRGYSTSSTATSRISQVTSYETTTMASSTMAYGSTSRTKYGAKAHSDAEIEYDQSYGNRIYTHLQGDDDATIPFVDWNYGNPTHDIDVWTDIHVGVTNNEDGSSILSLTGDIAGDGFPSIEAFVKDAKGNAIFMGVGAAKSGAVKGPTITLAGDKKEKQFDINMRIAVDKDGVFHGVYTTDDKGNETIMSPAAWNKQFESKDATGGH